MVCWESFLEGYASNLVVAADYLCFICLEPLHVVTERLFWVFLDVEQVVGLLFNRVVG